jgi:Family of unknown function (DUF5407)
VGRRTKLAPTAQIETEAGVTHPGLFARRRWIVALVLAVAGCAPIGTSVGVQPVTSAASNAADAMPLRYTLDFSNALAGPLTVTLTPGSRATLTGPASFTVAAGATGTATLSITAFTPGPIVDVRAVNANHSQTLHDIVSIVGSAVALRMHGLTGMDEDAGLRRNEANTEVTVSIRAKPAARARLTDSQYSVTVSNDLPSEPLDVSVQAGEHSVVHGPPSFSLEPDTSQTVRVTDRGALAIADVFDVVDAATKDVKAKMELLKGNGDNISIADMFEMQMLMNHLSQLSETTTSIVSASNSAIASMARNVKN